MSENRVVYGDPSKAPITLPGFRNLPCAFPFAVGYEPPTPEQVNALIQLAGWTQVQTAKLAGVTYKEGKGSQTVRKWKAPIDSPNYKQISYSTWRLLLAYAGVISLESDTKLISGSYEIAEVKGGDKTTWYHHYKGVKFPVNLVNGKDYCVFADMRENQLVLRPINLDDCDISRIGSSEKILFQSTYEADDGFDLAITSFSDGLYLVEFNQHGETIHDLRLAYLSDAINKLNDWAERYSLIWQCNSDFDVAETFNLY